MSDPISGLEREQAIRSEAELPATVMDVAIVSYNSRELLCHCLASIKPEPWQQVIVVDNLSSDGSAETVRREFPWVNLMVSKTNNGYGAAANLAIANCSAKYVLLLNADTVLQPGTLQVLRDYLDRHSQVAVVGPRLVNPDGTPQASTHPFPTPLQSLMLETKLTRVVERFPKSASIQVAQAVPWILGAALAFRRDAFEAVGGFDESFFMYYEEVDLCYRLHQAGWETHIVPQAVVVHVGGASTKHHRAAMLQQLYKSLCHFYQRHYSSGQKLQLRFTLTYLMLRNILKDSFRAYRSTTRVEAVDNLSVWRSVLASVWSKNGWLKN